MTLTKAELADILVDKVSNVTKNDAKEIVDVFASMDSPTDPSTAFKIDAILSNESDLEMIKEQNKELASEFTIQNNLVKINNVIENI